MIYFTSSQEFQFNFECPHLITCQRFLKTQLFLSSNKYSVKQLSTNCEDIWLSSIGKIWMKKWKGFNTIYCIFCRYVCLLVTCVIITIALTFCRIVYELTFKHLHGILSWLNNLFKIQYKKITTQIWCLISFEFYLNA